MGRYIEKLPLLFLDLLRGSIFGFHKFPRFLARSFVDLRNQRFSAGRRLLADERFHPNGRFLDRGGFLLLPAGMLARVGLLRRLEIVEIGGRDEWGVSLLLVALSENSVCEDPLWSELGELCVEVVLLAVDVVAEVVVSAEFGALHGAHQLVGIALRIVGDRILDDFAAVLEALEHVLEQIVEAVFARTARSV